LKDNHIVTPPILELVPWNAPMPAGPQVLLTTLSGIVWLLAAWFVRTECRRRHDLVPLYAFIGGGLIVVYEPLGDMLASVLYPVHGQWTWIDLFGRPIPAFIGILYFWYMSVPAVYFVKRVEQGLTRASLWRMYLFSLVLAIGIELFGVNVDAWVYYGPHPYLFFGVPLWCPVTYSGFLTVISIGLYLFTRHMDRKYNWLVILLVPACMAGGHMVLSLPAAAAMFSTTNTLCIWSGATLSIALSVLLVHLVSQVLCNDSVAARPSAVASIVP
jgi:uncharacterized membrane protein